MCFVESSPKTLANGLPNNYHTTANHLECMKHCKARDDCDGIEYFGNVRACYLKALPLKDVAGQDLVLGLKKCQPVV